MKAIPLGATWMGDTFVDAQGNPMVRVTGCPNCGKGNGWTDVISFAAANNSGRDLNAPCSNVCRYQLEYAATLGPRPAPQIDWPRGPQGG